MMASILIAEDDDRMREFIAMYMEEENWNVHLAKNGLETLDIFNNEKIDVIVLDIMMPGLNGKEICRKLRETSDVYIIMLTALCSTDVQVECLAIGADDYITKPFEASILIAKIKRVLNRNKDINTTESYEHKNFRINFLTHDIYINDEKVYFAPKEYDLLVYLIQAGGKVLTREHILNEIWGYDYVGGTRVVDNHILKIRKKINSLDVQIKTITGLGYKYEDN